MSGVNANAPAPVRLRIDFVSDVVCPWCAIGLDFAFERRQRGAALGFDFDMDRRQRTWNTFEAHRLLHWAGLEGRQRELKHALLRAYFTEGLNVGDRDTLVDIAAAVGLDADRAREILAGDAYADEVRHDEQYFLQAGIQAVPAIILERRHLVSGGQPPGVFEQALRHVAAEKRSAG